MTSWVSQPRATFINKIITEFLWKFSVILNFTKWYQRARSLLVKQTLDCKWLDELLFLLFGVLGNGWQEKESYHVHPTCISCWDWVLLCQKKANQNYREAWVPKIRSSGQSTCFVYGSENEVKEERKKIILLTRIGPILLPNFLWSLDFGALQFSLLLQFRLMFHIF